MYILHHQEGLPNIGVDFELATGIFVGVDCWMIWQQNAATHNNCVLQGVLLR